MSRGLQFLTRLVGSNLNRLKDGGCLFTSKPALLFKGLQCLGQCHDEHLESWNYPVNAKRFSPWGIKGLRNFGNRIWDLGFRNQKSSAISAPPRSHPFLPLRRRDAEGVSEFRFGPHTPALAQAKIASGWTGFCASRRLSAFGRSAAALRSASAQRARREAGPLFSNPQSPRVSGQPTRRGATNQDGRGQVRGGQSAIQNPKSSSTRHTPPATRYALSAIFLFLGIFNSFAQRLDITDVNSKSPKEPGFDLRLALGGTVNSDMTVSTRDGRSYPQQNINPLVGNCSFSGTVSYESVAFNPGFRFDFAPGYRLNEWIGFEFETGCIYNTVDSYTISGNGTFTGTGGNTTLNGTTTADAQGYLLQVPLLVNVEFSYPLEGGWRPFIGAGGGGMFQKMTIGTLTGDIQVQGDFNQSNFMGAWEAFLGFGYQVAPGFDVSLAYRLNGVLAPDFAGYTMQNFFTQAAEFGMKWRF